jgi:hypothetical protein
VSTPLRYWSNQRRSKALRSIAASSVNCASPAWVRVGLECIHGPMIRRWGLDLALARAGKFMSATLSAHESYQPVT